MEEETKKRKARLEALRNSRKKVATGELKTVDEIDKLKGDSTVEKQVSGIVENSIKKSEAERNQEDLDVTKIIQTNPDWDMKQLLQKKLEPLEFKTQKAIIDLIRMKLNNENEGDLVKAVNMQEYLQDKQKNHTQEETLE
ncbi:hypothetical protein BB559_005591 [Furculomyces boomerangus]|uniref:Uncharacterized protein n=1 Tax=Furculomyces boomerangus TaxID=61424 RepID=A0A2T9Y7Q0_9FUNG|nr:hypothetical protein BB559_005591 [Furculomyces boomerangus]